ncbi:alpha/beta fold hydrolase [Candidatus Micrarchaeota archaeon]|nr:alpha/beta fold hydrolase [Candidatus Micrarchaeota archaeon]
MSWEVMQFVETQVKITARHATISGLLARPDTDKPPGVLYLSGSGPSLRWKVVDAAAHSLASAGFAFLRFNYPAHEEGAAAGSDFQLDVDCAKSALDLLAQHCDPKRIGVVGKSYGARVAVELVPDERVRSLVLWAPAIRPEEGFRFRKPARIVHGTIDAVVPPQNSQELFKNIPGEKSLEIIPRADHGFAGKEHECARATRDWFEKWL